MNGIHAAFTGHLGKDCEVRTTRAGKPWAAFPVAVDTDVDSEAGTAWVRVALFGDTVEALAPSLTKGAAIYCEGRLTLRPWTDADGKARAGLSLAASLASTAHGADSEGGSQGPGLAMNNAVRKRRRSMTRSRSKVKA